MIHNYNYIDLFSGIGGFALGAKWAGIDWSNHFYSEIDSYCNYLYNKNFPNAIELGNIENIDCEKLKKKFDNNWIITGGFPCQDLSIAGLRKGIIKGERSSLWFKMLGIIGRIRPRFAIIENVPGLIFSGGLGVVLSGLAEIGYDAEWQSISAAQVGAWHKRERIWIITYPNEERRRQKQIFGGKLKNKAKFRNDGKKEYVPDTNSERKLQQEGTFKKKRGWTSDVCKKISNSNCSRLHESRSERGEEKFASIKSYCHKWPRWEFESTFCGMANGIPRRVDRIKGLGNSIIPQISYILFKLIKLCQ